MNELHESGVLVRAVKALTVAVWCLCALVLAQLAFYVFSFFRTQDLYRGLSGANRTQAPSITRGPAGGSLENLSPEEMIRKSSAILLTEWRRDGNELKSVVTEVLKLNPKTTLYFSVGDEFEPLSRVPAETNVLIDGHVVFLTGSPAMMRKAVSFSDGVVGLLRDMPLRKLRELAREIK